MSYRNRDPMPGIASYKEIAMNKRNGFALLAVIFGLIICVTGCPNSYALDNSLTPEEVVARHIKSIGSPEVLAAIKSRAIKGITSVKFTQTAIGNVTGGKSLIVSEGRKIAVVMNYGALNYPGEYLAYNGNNVTVGYIDFNLRSPLGAFVDLHDGLLVEGLWGGALSTAWPLLDMKRRMPTLKYEKSKIEGRKVHKLSYSSKSRAGLFDLRIDLFFDPETFRHIRTEYRYPYFLSNIRIIETFDDFRAIDGMMLPHKYDIEYSPIRLGQEMFMGSWAIEAKEFLHNFPIDQQIFVAQDLAQWRAK
jgi:hypothetical protein